MFLVGCSKDANDANNEKVIAELDFYSSKITQLINSLNNINLDNYELVSQNVANEQSQENLSKQNQSSSQKSESQSGGQSGKQSSGSDSQGGGNEQNLQVTGMQNDLIIGANRDDINWDSLKKEIEIINNSWNITMLDLSDLNVPNDTITSFSNSLNACILSIKNEDKNSTITNLNSMYSYIPQFLNNINSDKSKLNIETTKYYIFTTYTNVTQDDWNSANANIGNAERSFLSVLNDTEFSKNKEFKVNKTYLLIKDMQNSLTNNDKDLFYLKYKNLVESITTL